MTNSIGTNPNQIPVNGYLGDLAYRDFSSLDLGTAATSNSSDFVLALTGLNETLGITATKAFFYDTSLDYDNGAWRYNTDHTSWAKEDRSTGVYLGAFANGSAAVSAGGVAGDYYYSAGGGGFFEITNVVGPSVAETYRAGSQRFPTTAMITLDADRVVIWDASDGSMWWVTRVTTTTPSLGVLRAISTYLAQDVSAKDGKLTFALSSGVANTNNGFHFLDFAGDFAGKETSAGFSGTVSPLSDYNTKNITVSSSAGLIDTRANGITQTVLPNAPLDAVTGLPLVTTVVGTDGGLTILDGPAEVGGPPVKGNAVDITYTGGTVCKFVAFRSDGALVYVLGTSSTEPAFTHALHDLPATDQLLGTAGWQGTGSDEAYPYKFILGYDPYTLATGPASAPLSYVKSIEENAIAYENRVNFITQTRQAPETGGNPDSSQVIMKEDSISPVMTGATLGAWMASTDATVLSGAELVTNGDASSGTTGWTVVDATLIENAGRLEFTATANNGGISQVVPTVAGGLYFLTFDYEYLAGTDAFSRLGTIDWNGAAILSGTGTHTEYFIAFADNLTLGFKEAGSGNDASFALDNISVKEVDADVSPNENHLGVTGSLTRTPVATGSDLVGYSGFSASNYAEVPYDAAYDFGTGDFTFSCWINGATASDMIMNTQDGSNTEGVVLWSNGNANLSLITRAATLGSSVTGATVLSSKVGWYMVTGTCASGGTVLTVYIDNALEASATVTSRSIGGVDVPLKIGNNFNNTGPFAGSLALVSVTDRALTAEQIATKYNIERWWFQPNTTVTLDSSVVRDMAYDKALKRYHVLTDTGHSVFDAQSFTRLEYNAGDWNTIAVDDDRVVKG